VGKKEKRPFLIALKKNPIAVMADADGHNSAPHGRITANDDLLES
jgi:hypothetical protein